jgi:hypothetical protein
MDQVVGQALAQFRKLQAMHEAEEASPSATLETAVEAD